MEGQQPTPESPKRGTPWTLIVVGVIALYVIIVALLNNQRVEVDFLFFSASTRKLVLILLCLAAGFVAGFFFDRWRMRRKRAESAA